MTDPTPSNPTSNLDAQLEAEIEAALGDISLEEMVDLPRSPQLGKTHPTESAPGSPPAPPPASRSAYPGAPSHPRDRQRGAARERRVGTIVNVHGNDVFVEFGPRAQGVCPLDQFDGMPNLGEKIEFILNRFDSDDGLYILSREGSITKAEWESLEIGQAVEARCTGTNKGGLEMEVAGHKAFMPAGQVDLRHIEQLNVFIGEKMPCEVLELDRKRGRIILSRRSHLEAERKELRGKLLAVLDVGQIHPAVITTIKPYGAFADLGGVDGLIHISDLSYERVNDPSEVVKEGDKVEVKVLKIDESEDPPRIGLGLKQTQADPFEASITTLTVGSEVTGKITKIMQFGAFIQLSPGVEGLIHISELSHQRVQRVSQIVQAGQIVTAKILNIDEETKRIALSLKALQETGGMDEEAATREYRERESKGAPGSGPGKGPGGGPGGDRGGHGDKGRGDRKDRGRRKPDPEKFIRNEDPAMRKLRAQLDAKFGDDLKGGLS